MSDSKNAIVIVVDRLGSGFLGPYGNTWLETSSLNRLASRSILCENFMTDSLSISSVYRSYLRGSHAANQKSSRDDLFQLLEQQGVDRVVVSDDEEVLVLPELSHARAIFDVASAAENRAEGMGDCRYAQLFGNAIGALEETDEPFVFWLHSQGMQGAWDAPMELRERLAVEGDPDAYDSLTPPSLMLNAGFDPDELLPFTQAYAAQVELFDACLGILLDVFFESELADNTLLMFTSPRGFPLGEHMGIGQMGDRLFGESLQVPLLICPPQQQESSSRTHRFAQPSDVYSTLGSWFELPGFNQANHSPLQFESQNLLIEESWREPPVRDRIASFSSDTASLRTANWFYRRGSESFSLFVKPDDRWEVNDVAEHCPETAKAMDQALDQFIEAGKQGVLESLPTLPDEVLD